MYYEGIMDTPFLFQYLFPDSEQAKNFVSNEEDPQVGQFWG